MPSSQEDPPQRPGSLERGEQSGRPKRHVISYVGAFFTPCWHMFSEEGRGRTQEKEVLLL